MVSIIFFYRVDTMRIWFATDDGSRFIAQRVFEECPLIAANINNNIIFFY